MAGVVAISTQSLWIDEAYSALKAQTPDIQGFWKLNLIQSGSDQQMLLYMVGLWLWAKMAGTGEWCLRAFNLPWLALSLFTWMGTAPWEAKNGAMDLAGWGVQHVFMGLP